MREGHELLIAEHTSMYAIVGTGFGGDGKATSALPDLRGAEAALNRESLKNVDKDDAPGQLRYIIAVRGADPPPPRANDDPNLSLDNSPFVGEITLLAGADVPSPRKTSLGEASWLPSDGRLLEVRAAEELYSLMGSTYGGDGRRDFGLPNFSKRAASLSEVAGVKSGFLYVMDDKGWYPSRN